MNQINRLLVSYENNYRRRRNPVHAHAVLPTVGTVVVVYKGALLGTPHVVEPHGSPAYEDPYMGTTTPICLGATAASMSGTSGRKDDGATPHVLCSVRSSQPPECWSLADLFDRCMREILDFRRSCWAWQQTKGFW
jgi:hypothetical protein